MLLRFWVDVSSVVVLIIGIFVGNYNYNFLKLILYLKLIDMNLYD